MGQVQPVLAPSLAVMGTRQQAIDEPFVGVRPAIAEEVGDVLGRRRQSGEVIGDATDQRNAVGLGGGRPAEFLQGGQDEPVDRVAYPSGFLDPRRLDRLHGLVSPVAPLLLAERLGRCDALRTGSGLSRHGGGREDRDEDREGDSGQTCEQPRA